MQFNRTPLLLIILVALTFLQCDTEKLAPDEARVGFSYFPLEVGRYRIYDAREITYSILSFDTTNFQLMEAVVDSFSNQENTITYILNRSIRSDENDPWELDSVWTARRTPQQAIVTENNVPFLKLVFPVKERQPWDGNLLNTREEDPYEITALNEALTLIEDDPFSVLTVEQSNEDDLTKVDRRFETYAQDIGLVIKESTILRFCTESDCLGQNIIEQGRSFRISLLEYGKN
ncbi:hypothetical protein QQ008_13450 [Fulvivirgaceae bacterium BMA10]|uniref:Uncharacterized protein n=1 Tax=Splendidivirga corallicola TaxID=3051826 RepID=A0ABT8KNU3_9BACT|nr:hypothetical protein [Fulvivirgaceae bacterium BMA10]